MTTTKLLTIPAFARITGLSTWLARELVRRGDIPSVQVGPRKRIDSRWVERWTSNRTPRSNHRNIGPVVKLMGVVAGAADPELRPVFCHIADEITQNRRTI
jgi:hypothetical protein